MITIKYETEQKTTLQSRSRDDDDVIACVLTYLKQTP